MEETVDAADVDEGAVVGEGADGAGDDVALAESRCSGGRAVRGLLLRRRRGGRRLRLRRWSRAW